jgi:hypothetical protein
VLVDELLLDEDADKELLELLDEDDELELLEDEDDELKLLEDEDDELELLEDEDDELELLEDDPPPPPPILEDELVGPDPPPSVPIGGRAVSGKLPLQLGALLPPGSQQAFCASGGVKTYSTFGGSGSSQYWSSANPWLATMQASPVHQ